MVGGWNEMKLEMVCKLKHQNSEYKIIVFRTLSTNQLFAGCPTTLAYDTTYNIYKNVEILPQINQMKKIVKENIESSGIFIWRNENFKIN